MSDEKTNELINDGVVSYKTRPNADENFDSEFTHHMNEAFNHHNIVIVPLSNKQFAYVNLKNQGKLGDVVMWNSKDRICVGKITESFCPLNIVGKVEEVKTVL